MYTVSALSSNEAIPFDPVVGGAKSFLMWLLISIQTTPFNYVAW